MSREIYSVVPPLIHRGAAQHPQMNRKRLVASNPGDMALAISNGDVNSVKSLFKAGLLRPDGVLLNQPALEHALNGGNLEMIALFLDAGARLETKCRVALTMRGDVVWFFLFMLAHAGKSPGVDAAWYGAQDGQHGCGDAVVGTKGQCGGHQRVSDLFGVGAFLFNCAG